MKKVGIFYGTRPEYLKLKNIIKLIPVNKRDVIFTGQHDELLKNNFYTKKIDIKNKNQKKNRLNYIISQITTKIDLNTYDSVIIQGDTATTFAVAISAFNLKKKIIYIEAGLRSFDFFNPYPEEGYRQMISRVTDINFAPTKISKKNLLKENIKSKVIVSGNTSLDNLINFKKKTRYSNIVLITIHRRENLKILSDWFNKINEVAKNFKDLNFIYPIHANPEILKFKNILTNVKVINHLSHEKFINYLIRSKFIITDSGGIQEEASYLNKKVIVCRKTTERPEGIKSGHLFLCKKVTDLKRIISTLNKNYKIKTKCPYGDGKSSKRIVSYLKKNDLI